MATASGKKELRLNDQIQCKEVRLIGEEGEPLGVVTLSAALEKAKAAELDLVEISPAATPPVCRIMDYGKYKYQQAKREHEQKRKHQASELKQLRIKSFRIETHDVDIKRAKARQFIEGGNRVLFSMMFRAREHSHSDLGEHLLLEQFAKPLSDVARIDSQPHKDGKKMTMTLAPVPNLRQVLAARQKEEGKRKAEEARKLAEQQAAADLARTMQSVSAEEMADLDDDGSDAEDQMEES